MNVRDTAVEMSDKNSNIEKIKPKILLLLYIMSKMGIEPFACDIKVKYRTELPHTKSIIEPKNKPFFTV